MMGALDQEAAASDARLGRMKRVAVLYGEITAATREFLAALARSDRHRDWQGEGFASCAEWLAWQIGIKRSTANEKVRAARALEHLPLISDAMARGQLSFTKVRALTRAATPENEAELLAFGRAGSAASLERLVRGWKTLSRCDEAHQERIRHRRRCFSVFPDEDGMYVVRGRLSPEVGAVLMRAVEAAGDALFVVARKGGDDERDVPAPAQLRADAVGLLAERALTAGFGDRRAGLNDTAPVRGSRAERYQVMLHVEAATLREEGEPGRSELEDGTRVSAETARRLACDAGRVEVRHDSDGSVLDVGRRTRTIPPALRRALDARDRGCRFPGCGLRFTDAHHIVHWADGGETKLDNTLLLCRNHHRRVHEGGYQVCSDRDGQVVFFSPSGKAWGEVAPPPEIAADPLEALVRGNRERGFTPEAYGTGQRWRWDRDVPWHIEAAAREAIDPPDETAA